MESSTYCGRSYIHECKHSSLYHECYNNYNLLLTAEALCKASSDHVMFVVDLLNAFLDWLPDQKHWHVRDDWPPVKK